jgi:hypothetical protein
MISVRDYHNKKDKYPYVVAWEGEVFGYSFNKTPTSRMFTISCIDYTSYWDSVLTYFFNAQTSLAKGDGALAEGMEFEDAKKLGVKIVSLAHSTTAYFKQKIKDDKAKGKDYVDAFVSIIDEIGSINDFYKASESRLKVSDRVSLTSSGGLDDLMDNTAALEWFEGIMGKESGFATLRSVLNDLLSILFHDSVTIPFPSYAVNRKGAKNPVPANFVFKPNLFMVPPPACNIFFPDEYSSFNFSRNFFREPTRLIYKPCMPFPGPDSQVSLPHVYAPESFMRYMYKNYGKKGDNSIVDKNNDIATSSNPGNYGDSVSDNKTTKIKREQQFLTNEERFKGPLMAIENMMPASDEFRAALGKDITGDFSKKVANYLFYKKRFETREFSITGHLKLSVIPGFTALILDNSSSGQNVMAYVANVTHRIYATEGGYTTATFSYARTIQELQAVGVSNDPPVPPWFDPAIFGSVTNTTVPADKNAVVGADAQGPMYNGASNSALSNFFETLIGNKGNKALTDLYAGQNNIVTATATVIEAYQNYKKKPGADIMDFIAGMTDRDYVKISQGMSFMGATIDPNVDFTKDNFTEFRGGFLNPEGKDDKDQIQRRQDVIKEYRDALKAQRGFKG